MKKFITLLVFFMSGLAVFGQSGTSLIKKRIYFNFEGRSYYNDFQFNKADYLYYRSKPKGNYQDYSLFATEDASHPYLKYVAGILDQDAKEMNLTGTRLKEYIVAFAKQSIDYANDLDVYGNIIELQKYPIESLVEGFGDCEDAAALVAALLRTFGFDAVMVNVPGHMGAAVECTSNCSNYYNYNGKKYIYIECTSKYSKLGDASDLSLVDGKNASMLQVKRTAFYFREENTNPNPWATVTPNPNYVPSAPNVYYTDPNTDPPAIPDRPRVEPNRPKPQYNPNNPWNTPPSNPDFVWPQVQPVPDVDPWGQINLPPPVFPEPRVVIPVQPGGCVCPNGNFNITIKINGNTFQINENSNIFQNIRSNIRF